MIDRDSLLMAAIIARFGEPDGTGAMVLKVADHDLARLSPAATLHLEYESHAMEYRLRLKQPGDRPVVDGGELAPVTDAVSVTCPWCRRVSYNRGDVEHRFCAACGAFHDSLPRIAALTRGADSPIS